MDQNTQEPDADRHAISFVVGSATLQRVEEIAASEGLSRAAIARRALLRDLAARREASHVG